jgi:Domain of unknown function DUF488
LVIRICFGFRYSDFGFPAAIMENREDALQMGRTAHELFSIGHSNHEWPALLRLLQNAGVTAVADVRSVPYSRRLVHVSRPELERGLGEHGIAYVYLGHQLGGRPEDPGLFDADGRADYERIRQTMPFQEGLVRLREGLKRYAVAMFCAEEDPLHCHRGLMIAPALLEAGVATQHIRGDGRIETMGEMEQRLLEDTRVGEGMLNGLFAAQITPQERRDLIAAAYRKQAARAAFRKREDETE